MRNIASPLKDQFAVTTDTLVGVVTPVIAVGVGLPLLPAPVSMGGGTAVLDPEHAESKQGTALMHTSA